MTKDQANLTDPEFGDIICVKKEITVLFSTRFLSAIIVAILLLTSSGGCSGCHSSVNGEVDALPDSPDEDQRADGDQPDGDEDQGDVHEDIPEDATEEEDPSLPYVPQCGNGVLDEEEECDDRNRLNGDGCDWLCMLGDGDPPPLPDPGVDPYVVSGDPVPVEDAITTDWYHHRLPLSWTGSEFSTAFYIINEDDSKVIRFMRFDEEGRPIGSDWRYPVPPISYGLDLVWTGTGYGLFYVDTETGIYFLRLNTDGKPLGSPVLVEADSHARVPAADNFGDGFVLAWLRKGSVEVEGYCVSYVPPDELRLKLLHADGTTAGLPGPVTVEDRATYAPDVANGEDGFGLTVGVIDSLAWICSLKFIWVSHDLSIVVYSGILADGVEGDVLWVDDQFFTAWDHLDIPTAENETCVARFDPDGVLESPPVCNDITSVTVDDPGPTRLAAGDGGLLAVTAFGGYPLLALRTDMNGTAVSPHVAVQDNDFFGGAFGVARGTDRFFILVAEGSQMQLYELVAE